MRTSRSALTSLLVLTVVTGCATSAAPRDAASASADRATVVVLGDSLSTLPPHDCPGCTGYADRFAAAWQKASGAEVTVVDDAVDDSQLAGATARIAEKPVIADLARADVVIVWIGNNDGPPYNPDTPCSGDNGSTADEQAAAVEAYTSECIAATVELYGERYATLFARITELSPHATARLAVTTLDNWAGNPAFATAEFPAERTAPLLDEVVGIFSAWNSAQCASAQSSGFRCVDLAGALNGSDGRAPLGDNVADDYTHLSQKGHDALASLLIAAAAP